MSLYPLKIFYTAVLLMQDPHTGETVKEIRSEKAYTYNQCQQLIGGATIQKIDPKDPQDLVIKLVCEPVINGKPT